MDIKYNHTYFHAYYKEVLLFHKIKTYISVDPAEDAIICAMLKNEIDEIKMAHSWFELNANVFRSPSKGHFAVLLEKVSVLDELLRLAWAKSMCTVRSSLRTIDGRTGTR